MRVIFTIVLGALGVAFAATASAAVEPQTLLKGQSTTIAVDYEIGDVAAGDPAVCDFLVATDRRSLTSTRAGRRDDDHALECFGRQARRISSARVTTTLKDALERARDAVGS